MEEVCRNDIGEYMPMLNSVLVFVFLSRLRKGYSKNDDCKYDGTFLSVLSRLVFAVGIHFRLLLFLNDGDKHHLCAIYILPVGAIHSSPNNCAFSHGSEFCISVAMHFT